MGFGWFHTYKNKRLCKRENKWFFERKGSFGFGWKESIKQNFLPLVLSNEVTPEFVL